jgi:DNA mismatch repair protein MSH2
MSNNTKDEDMQIEPGSIEGLIKANGKLGEKPTTTVRIFERNTRYYCLEKDAELAARYVYGSVTATKTMMTGPGKNTPVMYSITNQGNFESLLRYLILVKHYRVEIYKFSKVCLKVY